MTPTFKVGDVVRFKGPEEIYDLKRNGKLAFGWNERGYMDNLFGIAFTIEGIDNIIHDGRPVQKLYGAPCGGFSISSDMVDVERKYPKKIVADIIAIDENIPEMGEEMANPDKKRRITFSKIL